MNKVSLKARCLAYAFALFLMLAFTPVLRWTGETNLPPLLPASRAVVNGIFLLMVGGYIWVIACQDKSPLSNGVWAVFLAVAVLLCAMPPVFSGDAYEYLMRGRIFGVYHLNPYAHASGEFSRDLFYPFSIWHHLPENYGPSWVLLQWIAPTFFGHSVPLALAAHKGLLLVFFVLSGILFHKINRHVSPGNEEWLTRLYLLNPNLWVHHLVDGHNDIVMIFWMLLAVYAILKQRWLAGMALAAVAVLVKFSSAVLLPVLGLMSLRACSRSPVRRICTAFGQILIVFFTFAVFYAPFWIGRDTWRYFLIFKDWFYSNSIPYAVHMALGKMGWVIEPSVVAGFFRYFFMANSVLAVAWLAARKDLLSRDAFRATSWIFGAMYVSYAIPFYGHHLNWAIPFFILGEFPARRVGLCLFSFAGLFAYFKRLSFLFLMASAIYAAWLIYSQRIREKMRGC